MHDDNDKIRTIDKEISGVVIAVKDKGFVQKSRREGRVPYHCGERILVEFKFLPYQVVMEDNQAAMRAYMYRIVQEK